MAETAPELSGMFELFTDPSVADPLGRDLGFARMVRLSPLAPVPDAC